MQVVDSPGFRMADRLAKGKLVQVLRKLRAENVSPDRIARILFADYGIETSRPTVDRWCQQLGIDHDAEPDPEAKTA